ncbi:MAG: hypothetical protein LQ338_004960 [Usnochroma carphineum]|nr:MAG: hypothetical protein LQ338_004960 [Usnochroma carphineum]
MHGIELCNLLDNLLSDPLLDLLSKFRSGGLMCNVDSMSQFVIADRTTTTADAAFIVAGYSVQRVSVILSPLPNLHVARHFGEKALVGPRTRESLVRRPDLRPCMKGLREGDAGYEDASVDVGKHAEHSEEIQDASTVVPRTMVATTLLNGVLGFAALIAILFCAGDIEAAEKSATGYPFKEIFCQATKSAGGATAMSCVILLLVYLATSGLIATASRMTWAFPRDNGLPGSRWLAKVEPRSALPLYSIGITVIISLLLALINIESTTAFNAIISLSVASVLASYVIPISLMLRKRFLKEPIRFGPWRLGRWGALANVVGLVYAIIGFFFSFWPGESKVTAKSMNWACLVWGFAMLFCSFWYLIRARKYYHGPVNEIE